MYQSTEYLLIRRDGKVVWASQLYEEVKNWFNLYTYYYGDGVYRMETRTVIHESE